ncbi:heavy metal translocating P-type ATPase [Vibrio gallicus]|uniref:heavy metal translocating P-type ATPase n=1 Tax=Vibrio gallicus TaxID=190897 RepID=UPI0021C3A035|nr:heavy metal translocating P-type ATPase [Vibrio gallicus]
MNEFNLPVSGVSCQGCVSKIRKAVCSIDAQCQLDVDIESQSMQYRGVLSPDEVSAVVDNLGYLEQASTAEENLTPCISPTMASIETVHLSLEGVSCAGCVNTIQKAVESVDGVDSVLINFANRTAEVTTTTTAHELISAIEGAGYGALEINDQGIAEQDRQRKESQQYRYKMRQSYLGLAVGVPLMLYGMLGGSMSVESSLQQWIWLAVGAVTLMVLIGCGRQYFVGASKAFVNRNANMDTLIALGTGSAWLYSMAVVVMPDLFPQSARHLYFEASAMIIGLINLGQALELKARGKTSQAIRRLLDLRAKTALVIRDGSTVSVPVERVQVGDHIVIRAGESVPVDAVIIQGSSVVDESMLTGEPVPVEKQTGENVSAGTVNGNSSITVVATKVGKETALSQIIDMVVRAQNSKPSIARLADTVSGVFVPSVMIISVLTALAWYNFGTDPVWVHMLVAATSVLIIACPCALGLATPISTMIGIGKAAQFGGLIRNGDALQRASDIDVVVLDKTGTITQGNPSVVDSELLQGEAEKDVLPILKALELGSTHPLAEAILRFCDRSGHVEPLRLDQVDSLAGQGVTGRDATQQYLLGNERLMHKQGICLDAIRSKAMLWEREANTVVYLSDHKQLLAAFAIQDPIKAESATAINSMQRLGLQVVMLTGDNHATATAVAHAAGVEQYHAQLSPQDKLDWIERLQQQGKVVAMVGDGINDAPALARSDVGFAIGQGTDVAIESADITLMSGSLFGVSQVIETSKATMRNIKQNLWGAFIYNALGIPIAAGILFPITGWLLSPIIAGIAMSLSSITVVSNANRLRLFTPRSTREQL